MDGGDQRSNSILKPDETAKKAKAEPAERFYAVVGFLIIIVLPCWAVWHLCPDSLRYSIFYSVEANRVKVDKKPNDCNWDHAPIGDKSCHYEKEVDVNRNESGKVIEVFVTWHRIQE